MKRTAKFGAKMRPSWKGLFASVGTPPEVVEKLGAEVNNAMRSPDIKDFFAAHRFSVFPSANPEFRNHP